MPGSISYQTGGITYNGFDFPPALHSSIQYTFVKDSTGRATKYVEGRITVEGIIAEDVGEYTNEELYSNIRTILSQPGKSLQITNQGLGDLTIDHTTNFVFGPHPEVLLWEPIGAYKAARIVWTCSYTTLSCSPTASFGGFLIVEYAQEVSFSISKEGMTTYTTTGHVEIDNLRVGNGTQKSPDGLRDHLNFPRLANFHRETRWTTSPDRLTLSFSITDTEIPSDVPYAPGMVDMQVNERLKGGQAQGEIWSYSLNGSITIGANVPRVYAWVAFLNVVQSRISQITQGTTKDGTTAQLILPTYEFENEIYGRSLRFSISYTIVCRLQDILKASGIWRPVSGDWNEWSNSMENVQGNRGIAFLGSPAHEDVIVDTCTPLTNGSPKSAFTPNSNYAQPLFTELCPSEEQSWIMWKNILSIHRDQQTLAHTPVSPGDSQSQTTVLSVDAALGGNATQEPPPTTNTNLAIQDRGTGTGHLVMQGMARRVNHKINAPRVVSIGGIPATLMYETVVPNRVIGFSGTQPIYETRWLRVYYFSQGVNGKDVQLEGVPTQYHSQ